MALQEHANSAYERLSAYLQVIRDSTDSFVNASPDPQSLEAHIPMITVYWYETGEIMNCLLRYTTPESDQTVVKPAQLWIKAYDTSEILSALLIDTHNKLHPDTPISEDTFEPPGTDVWRQGYICASLLARASYEVQEGSTTDKSLPNDDACVMCSDPCITGERCVQLSCPGHHRVHEICLKKKRDEKFYYVHCPKCRKDIDILFQENLRPAIEALEVVDKAIKYCDSANSKGSV